MLRTSLHALVPTAVTEALVVSPVLRDSSPGPGLGGLGEVLARGRTEVVALATPRELAGLPSLIDAHLAVDDDVEVRALLALDDDRLLRLPPRARRPSYCAGPWRAASAAAPGRDRGLGVRVRVRAGPWRAASAAAPSR
eukprot:scaffold86304_cov58-Phaeocystis_antarctica.AAC.3